MKTLFQYNWIVREQWYQWCEETTPEELQRVRVGGVGGILHTLFHIVDVEWSWIRVLQDKPDFQEDFENYNTLEKVRNLDKEFKQDVEPFVNSWNAEMETRPLDIPRLDGTVEILAWGEVMRHVIAHEIHHVGQLSVWSREVGKPPVSANLIRKGLIQPNETQLQD
ncbi:damage-inducible protein DinB [Paenibacillus swuensis]|uniref:Damage-inducible protein DinB n=1 Tax=Paenibacillus swuensis TaxID=1178515 RepID=A0A172TH09_9BACL|nr:DinB family protein [Paenibacillus swuensis]ANE46339.1 damage-inducible protein DinB [Paenibacillus swuensis]